MGVRFKFGTFMDKMSDKANTTKDFKQREVRCALAEALIRSLVMDSG